MGISTLQSYQSAQIFEAVGICKEVIDSYFTNTVSPVAGIGLKEIAEGVQWRHNHAFDPLDLGVDTTLDSVGTHKLRSGSAAEDHLYNPKTIIALQEAAAVRRPTTASRSTPTWWTTSGSPTPSGACWNSTIPRTAAFLWRR